MRANAEMGFSHIESLLAVKSVSEFIELQTAFLRKGVETMVEQAKDMQSASTKAVEDMSQADQGRLREGCQGTQGRLINAAAIRIP